MEEIFRSFKKLTSSTLPAAKKRNGDTKRFIGYAR